MPRVAPIADRIKQARQKKNLTQEQLAAKLGCTKATVSRYETEDREPDLEMITRIAAALQVSVASLTRPEPDPAADSTEPAA
jgi:transcriptional regulator with XRE-family HTH domain